MIKTILFEHIPKTAGTTIHNILESYYPAEKVISIDGIRLKETHDKLNKLDENDINELFVIKGHIILPYLERIKNPFLFTFFREPVDRFISQFYHIKNTKANRFYEQVKDMDLDDYVDFSIESYEDNIQTRFLSNTMHHRISNTSNPPSLQKDGGYIVKEALKNIERFNYIFLTSLFDHALIIMMHELKWKKLPLYTKANVKSKIRLEAEQITSKTIKKIEFSERFDIELYQRIKKRNEILLDNYSYTKELNSFRFKNRIYQKKQNFKSQIKRLISK